MIIGRFIIVFILLYQNGFAQTANLSAKRRELINNYSNALDRVWQISETVPPDFYFSSLGINLLNNQTDDPKINSMIGMAAANILYLASLTSLNMADSFLKKQQKCNTAFDKYKKTVEGTCTQESLIEKNICIVRESECQTHLKEYFIRFDSMVLNQRNFPVEPNLDNGTSFASLSAPFFLNSFMEGVKYKCARSGFDWSKRVGEELENACLPVVDSLNKDHIFRDEVFEETKKRNEIGSHACKETRINYHKIPPIMYQNYGQNIRNTNCVDPLFMGIDIPKPTALKQTHMFLLSNERRSFYWLQMAEEAFDQVKRLEDSKKEKVQITKSIKITTVSKCVSPILDKQFCTNFSQKIEESLKSREGLDFLSDTLSDIKKLGDNFNARKEITQYDLEVIERLSKNLDRNKKNAETLKSAVQEQLIRARFAFDFKRELEKM